ncbi:hypothetical protein LCGC14_1089030 [marine sediment metagenome]|uniref:Uncharacterized protein n=1 Tax=marine sediment metagenome TaxID=412755 RepID=A0A0F9MHE5_9ZZZZ
MNNPFLNKSLPELKAMTPGLADPELNALCAAMCDEKWVRWYDDERFIAYRIPERAGWFCFESYEAVTPRIRLEGYYEPTSDGREAMRLLEKLLDQGQVGFHKTKDGRIVLMYGESIVTQNFAFIKSNTVYRAITEAAVVAGLTEMIEKNKNDKGERDGRR